MVVDSSAGIRYSAAPLFQKKKKEEIKNLPTLIIRSCLSNLFSQTVFKLLWFLISCLNVLSLLLTYDVYALFSNQKKIIILCNIRRAVLINMYNF